MSTPYRAGSKTIALVPLAILCLFSLLFSACAVPLDSEPRAIDAAELDEDLLPSQTPTIETTSAEALAPLGLSAVVYLVNASGTLEPVSRKANATPGAVLEALLEGPTEAEQARGLVTALSDVEVVTVDVSSLEEQSTLGIVGVRLSEDSLALSVKNEEQTAFAQMVYTLAALPQIDFVEFTKEGDQGSIPTDDGAVALGTRVDRSSFASLAPRARPDIGFADDPGTAPSNISFYFVNAEDKLEPTARETDPQPQRLLRELFRGPSVAETRRGLTTTITGIARANVTLDPEGQLAIIDLVDGSIPGDGPLESEQRGLALAQIVYTITELPAVETVVISIDGVTLGQFLSRETFRDQLAFAP